MNIGIEYAAALLLIAALVAMAVRRLNVPYTVGLMLTGIVLAVSSFPSDDIRDYKGIDFLHIPSTSDLRSRHLYQMAGTPLAICLSSSL